jgi:hypothetical protein
LTWHNKRLSLCLLLLSVRQTDSCELWPGVVADCGVFTSLKEETWLCSDNARVQIICSGRWLKSKWLMSEHGRSSQAHPPSSSLVNTARLPSLLSTDSPPSNAHPFKYVWKQLL